MEPYRLKVRVGVHEFEAEGSQEAVERQFALWRELVTSLPSPPPVVTPLSGQVTPTGNVTIVPVPPPAGGSGLDKIFRREGRVITLTVLPTGDQREQDAALLLMLAQQIYNSEDMVTGNTLLEGLKRSGLSVERIDRLFGDYMEQYVLRNGVHRAVRYRLTNPGAAKARELGHGLVNLVA